MALSVHEPRPTACTTLGRRTLLTPQLIEAVAHHVRNGASPRHAVIAAGVSANTCDEWHGDLEARIASDPHWRAKARALEAREADSWRRDQAEYHVAPSRLGRLHVRVRVARAASSLSGVPAACDEVGNEDALLGGEALSL